MEWTKETWILLAAESALLAELTALRALLPSAGPPAARQVAWNHHLVVH